MTFIITLIALIIERFFDWSHLRQWRWLSRYQIRLSKYVAHLSPVLALTICVLPIVLLVGLVYCLLSGVLFGVVKLVLGVIVFVYCLGPNNFWAQVYAAIAELHKDDAVTAVEQIQKEFNIEFPHEPQAFHLAFTSALFIEAHARVFAVLFWFVILGPMGAVLYRLVEECGSRGLIAVPLAKRALRCLDWLPVRVFTFIFALGGHFTGVIRAWRSRLKMDPSHNDDILTACGIASLDVLENGRLPEDGSVEKETLALLDRVFVMSLVFLAFAVLLI